MPKLPNIIVLPASVDANVRRNFDELRVYFGALAVGGAATSVAGINATPSTDPTVITHQQLSMVYAADPTSSSVAHNKHVSNLQTKHWEDHAALVNEHIDWTAATEDFSTTGDAAVGGDLGVAGDVEGGTGHFGGATDHSEFESDGTLKFNGAATVWKDELGQLLGKRLENPSSRIVENIAEGSLTFKDNATTADYVVASPQINHDWKFGTNLHVHFHWWQVSANFPNWLLQYRWQRNGQAKTTTWTSVIPAEHTFTYVSGTLCQITEFVEITPPANYGISDILQIRLIRDTGNASGLFAGADPESSDVDAVSFDFHKEIDTVGSRLEYQK